MKVFLIFFSLFSLNLSPGAKALQKTSTNKEASTMKFFKDPKKIKALSDLQRKVTQKDGTEPAFKNKYWDNKKEGIYVDIVSGEPLFSSKAKFKSGTGWPSFYQPIEEENIVTKTDRKFFMTRTEVRSKHGDSHLGHVFKDGPQPTGLRYCINSASLRFIPVEDLEKEGYAKYLKLFNAKPSNKNSKPSHPENSQQATSLSSQKDYIILAGGCFWGMEDLLREFKGVTETEVGYSGGKKDKANYIHVKTGSTGHAEAVKVTFDTDKVSLKEIFHFFFKIHDPTTLNRQGNDVGKQYRSAVFTRNSEQDKILKEVIKEVDALKRFKKPIVTQIEKEEAFYSAESYHQDYLKKNPGGYTCHFIRD